ncbi:MAG: inositol monophosphatase family protein [Coleofasciculus sp. C1-SOL-03]|uniref:inositol monophosphatase family protein n=1 Tax=Coleofasciculus sp. C1-SOL-03 TaxID=3069522 RepID=UPI0032F6FD45
MDYLPICSSIAENLTTFLDTIPYQNQSILQGKAKQEIDHKASEIIDSCLADYPINLYLQGEHPKLNPHANYSIFVDPIDGTSNWLRQVGDPSFVMAIAAKSSDVTLGDLNFAYVRGLRSGDCYYGTQCAAYFRSAHRQDYTQIYCHSQVSLEDAIAYLRPGYHRAKEALSGSFPLWLCCRDIRSVDNSAMELCEIARGAADFMVECRHASENYNLLAYPILKSAGGYLVDFRGNSLASLSLESEYIVDYVACGSGYLLREILHIIQRWEQNHEKTFRNFLGEIERENQVWGSQIA